MRRLAALLLLALTAALPAGATQDAWPALHDVTGVAPDDVLNIRAEPDAQSEIIGSLAPDATDIEVIAPSDNHRWGLVNVEGGTGWASLRYLRRQPGQWLGAVPPLRHCFGTEPFWSLLLPGEGKLRFATPGEEVAGIGFRPVASQNRRDRYAMTFRLDDGRQGVLIAGLAQCSDGMSDRAYGLTGDILFSDPQGPALLSGCCTLTAPGTAPDAAPDSAD